MVQIIAGLVTDNKNYMNRKNFFTLISTSFLGIAFLRMNPLKLFGLKKNSSIGNSMKVKINPLAVNRDKTGKKNG